MGNQSNKEQLTVNNNIDNKEMQKYFDIHQQTLEENNTITKFAHDLSIACISIIVIIFCGVCVFFICKLARRKLIKDITQNMNI